jgi:nucleotide-binding universal stress UspA family protein
MQYFHLDQILGDRKLVHLLPSEIAHRYHALPVAVDGRQITVAMAHPEDGIARDSIAKALGASTCCFVEADLQIVDDLIEQLWPQNANSSLRILSWSFEDEDSDDVRQYTQAIAKLLSAETQTISSNQISKQSLRVLFDSVALSHPDLVIFRIPDKPLLKRLLPDAVERKLVDKIPTSLMVIAQKVIWPIDHILLVLENNDVDESAVQWGVQFAHLCNAKITLLPLLPTPPAMFASIDRLLTPDQILASNCQLGKQLRRIARQLDAWNIQGSVKIRHEPAEQQIHCELLSNHYGLIIVGSKPQNTFQRWAMGDTVHDLLHGANLPILIAKSNQEIA